MLKFYNHNVLLVLLSFSFPFLISIGHSESTLNSNKKIPVKTLKEKITHSLNGPSGNLPSKINLGQDTYRVSYNVNERLENFVQDQIKNHRPDFASVVVIDNDSGNIITAIDYSRKDNQFARHLTFANTHPAASVFKIITAAELLKTKRVKKDSMFAFNGRSTTLYKYQLNSTQLRHRWVRHQTLEEAFAKSNNVVFGRAGINYVNPSSLYETAESFGFNNLLLEDLLMEPSLLKLPDDQYGMAEFASGFNTDTQMSPVHGAVIASIIANDGILRTPSLISHIEKEGDKTQTWAPICEAKNVLPSSVSRELQDMMEMTISKGTAKGPFKRAKGFPFNSLEIGGKTGSITGGIPYGKRDWFVSYAKPKDNILGKGLSICVMIVNQKKWYVKSTQLAKNIIEHYYKHLNPVKKFYKLSGR